MRFIESALKLNWQRKLNYRGIPSSNPIDGILTDVLSLCILMPPYRQPTANQVVPNAQKLCKPIESQRRWCRYPYWMIQLASFHQHRVCGTYPVLPTVNQQLQSKCLMKVSISSDPAPVSCMKRTLVMVFVFLTHLSLKPRLQSLEGKKCVCWFRQ